MYFNDLLLLYDNFPGKATLDIEQLTYDVISFVLKREKNDLLDPKLQQNVNKIYPMIFAGSNLSSAVEY